MKKILIALLLALPLSATAAPAASELVRDFHSEAGESYHDFAARVGRFINGWTASTGAEACGAMTKSPDGQFHVLIQSQMSQVSCDSTLMLGGTEQLLETIHSHPEVTGGQLVLTTTTRQLLAKQGFVLPEVLPIKHTTFSKGDYATGAGFLVTSNELWYQSGQGTAKKIAALPKAGT